jgi:hypothetical protein
MSRKYIHFMTRTYITPPVRYHFDGFYVDAIAHAHWPVEHVVLHLHRVGAKNYTVIASGVDYSDLSIHSHKRDDSWTMEKLLQDMAERQDAWREFAPRSFECNIPQEYIDQWGTAAE